eukprot:scaffold82390_cov54-Phaeocystis_antarctica.AAC.1
MVHVPVHVHVHVPVHVHVHGACMACVCLHPLELPSQLGDARYDRWRLDAKREAVGVDADGEGVDAH